MNIILLHGWGVNKDIFKTFESKLSEYNIYKLDFPGFGSAKLDRAYTLDDYVEYLRKFIVSNNIDNPIFISHSFGSRVGLKYSSVYDVDKHIILNGAGIRIKGVKYYYRVLMHKLSKLLGLNLNFNSVDYKNASENLKITLSCIVKEDLRYLLKNIQTDTLLVYGTKDKDTPVKVGKILNKYIKNSYLIKLNTDHFSFLENPALIAQICKHFIKGE